MTPPPRWRFALPALAGLLALVVGLGATLIARTTFTGDEPRYLYYAASFAQRGDFRLGLEGWRAFAPRQPIPGAASHAQTDGAMIVSLPGQGPLHAVGLPVIAAPLIGLAPGVPVGRILSLLLAAATLVLAFQLLRANGIAGGAAWAAVAIGGLSIPFLPYAGLFYPEVAIAFLITAGWRTLHTPLTPRSAALVMALAIAIPFVHLRGVGGSAVLGALLMWRIASAGGSMHRGRWLAATAAAFALGAILFAATNLGLYGHILGSVTTARPGFTLGLLSELFFNYRHGLMLFSPVFAFGILGMLMGLRTDRTLALQATLFLAAVIAASLGPNPGECPPARFMVQAVPPLVAGLAIALNRRRPKIWYAAFAAALLWTAVTAIDYLVRPGWYLHNRTTCLTCFELLRTAGWGGGKATYHVRTLSVPLPIGIEGFGPDPLPRAAIVTMHLAEHGTLDAIDVRADDGKGGAWTTRGGLGYWGIAVMRHDVPWEPVNRGARREDLGIETTASMILVLPDNGILAACAPVTATLRFRDGRHIAIPLRCAPGVRP